MFSVWIFNYNTVMIEVIFLRYIACETGIENSLWKRN